MITTGDGHEACCIYQDGERIGCRDYDEPGSGQPFIEIHGGNFFANELREIADYLDTLGTRQTLPG